MWIQAASVALLPILVLCFSQQDNDIFRLRDKIIEDFGEGTTFYSWLGVKKGASVSDIGRAYRKLSRKIHPDRNPGAKADEIFARLNQVHKLLRSPLRERYDYYLSVGFPCYDSDSDSWYYKRYRPSLLFVLVLLSLIYTGIQLLVLKTTAHRRRQHLSDLITDAKQQAASTSPTGVITGITRVNNGSNLLVVHPTGEVYFEGTKLDPEVIEEPTWKDTHAGKLYLRLRYGPSAEDHSSHVHSKEEQETKSSEDVETSATSAVSSSADAKEGLKKGAARRRPAGARGKAKIF